jgi:carbamoyl-phosphate synthase small subunit
MEVFLATSAFLALATGDLFRGLSIGATGVSVGEVVFNTSMTGYQEILTDPSYARQMVTLTYPHIGNTGVNAGDEESRKIWCEGLIIRDLPVMSSNWRSEGDLSSYLKDRGTLGIADIDTRRLTRILRDKGAQSGCLVAGDAISEAEALEKARAFAGLKGMDLAREVTADGVSVWTQGTWQIGQNDFDPPGQTSFRVAAWDFGVKRNILRMLAERGCEVHVFPATAPAEEVLAIAPDGIFLSNGPGDPEPCDYAIRNIRAVRSAGLPVFGICLGHQLLALASGAQTVKMRFGHHGANHPVQDLATGAVMISSQNHGFAVDEASLPEGLHPTHRSLFDGSLQGIETADGMAFGFQGHPEASPGPQDLSGLFDRFIDMMRKRQSA